MRPFHNRSWLWRLIIFDRGSNRLCISIAVAMNYRRMILAHRARSRDALTAARVFRRCTLKDPLWLSKWPVVPCLAFVLFWCSWLFLRAPRRPHYRHLNGWGSMHWLSLRKVPMRCGRWATCIGRPSATWILRPLLPRQAWAIGNFQTINIPRNTCSLLMASVWWMLNWSVISKRACWSIDLHRTPLAAW